MGYRVISKRELLPGQKYFDSYYHHSHALDAAQTGALGWSPRRELSEHTMLWVVVPEESALPTLADYKAAAAQVQAQTGDLKEALSSGRKPDTTHVRYETEVYIARASEYGDDKYQRGNYLRPAGSVRDSFKRHRQYLRSVRDHIAKILGPMERHLARDPLLEDEDGMLAAVRTPDLDVTPGAKVGASGLPHHAHAAAAMNMLITQAVDDGLLPADPGQPWKPREK
jgi:hypothetical protein